MCRGGAGWVEHLRALTIASAPWSFPPRSIDAGRAMFARMPYASAPVAWSDRAFDDIYTATWWPTTIPTLILGGADDRIVDQTLWDDARFTGANIAASPAPATSRGSTRPTTCARRSPS